MGQSLPLQPEMKTSTSAVLRLLLLPLTLSALIEEEETCHDHDENCPGWAELGYCNSGHSVNYMTVNCQKSCFGCCPPDGYASCPGWARQGYCQSETYGNWMSRNCHESCSGCCSKHDYSCIVKKIKKKMGHMQDQINTCCAGPGPTPTTTTTTGLPPAPVVMLRRIAGRPADYFKK